MKKIFTLFFLLVMIKISNAQTVIANWTFETSSPATAGPFNPEIGAGFASGTHTSTATYSSPTGNGSAKSYNSNTWAVGDYYQFQVATTGLSNIAISFDHNGSGTGPSQFKLQYSTDGTSFADWASYVIPSNAGNAISWSSSATNNTINLTSFSFDLSSLTQLNNKANIYFRITCNGTNSIAGATIGSGGTSRVDNVIVTSGAAIYYYVGTGSLTNLTNWGSNADGSGSNPASLFTPANTYKITNTTTATLSANVAFGGKVEIGSGVTLQTGANSFVLDTTTATLIMNASSVLSVNSASGIVDCKNRFVTLKSDANGAACIANVQGKLLNATNVLAYRYIPAKRAFRLLASPVTTTTNISNAWQSSFGNNNGFGTHITGSVSGANGFDASATGNPSMFTFDNTTQTWNAIANTNATNFANATGYRILIRGDRTIDLSASSPAATATTLGALGILTVGNVLLTTSSSPSISGTANNYSLLGNPYASAVDWDVLTKSNISTTYWIWDPNLTASGFNKGGYVSWTTGSGSSNGSGVTGSSAINNVIQSGQAFFVRTNGAFPTLTFAESNKVTTSSTATFDTKIIKPRLNIALHLQGETHPADATAVVFDNNFKNTVGEEDAPKLENPYENIAVAVKGTLVGLEGHSANFIKDTIQLNTWKLAAPHYELNITAENFTQLNNIEATLLDKYSNTATKIDLFQNNKIAFDINDEASKAANRFALFLTSTQPVTIDNTTTNKFTVTAGASKNNITVNYAAPKAGLTTVRLMNTIGTVLQTQNLGVQQIGKVVLLTTSTANAMYLVEVKIGEDTVVRKIISNNN